MLTDSLFRFHVQTETSEDQDFQTTQVMKTIIIHSSMARDNFENPFRVKGKTVLLYHAVPSFAFT